MAFKRLMNKRNTELNNQAAAVDKIQNPTQTTQTAQASQKPTQVQAQAKPNDAAMKEALRVAQELERMEEEEMIKRAIEESQKLEASQKAELEQEEAMIRQAILLSQQEEDQRQAAVK